jgi:hypothetical protein
MAGPGEIDKIPVTVADRFDAYRIEIEKIVTRGIEHPNYELKRTVTISKDNLADRLDFVKLIPGVERTLSNVSVRRFGNTAILTGIVTTKSEGKAPKRPPRSYL